MKNKLFFVCPECQMEHFIQEHYDQDVFFLTALGAVFDFQDTELTDSLNDFITKNSITDIFIVNDTSCSFIKSVLENEKGFGTSCETTLLNLLIDHYSIMMTNLPPIRKQEYLGKVNCERQANEIVANESFKHLVSQTNISIKGLVTTKSKNKIAEYTYT